MTLRKEDMKQVKPPDEVEILAELRRGDEKVLRQIYRQHYPMAMSLVVNNGGSLHEAKDVYQEALIIFTENVRKDDFHLSCSIKTYLYSVCRRIWLAQLRKKGSKVVLDETDEFAEVDEGDAQVREHQFEAMDVALKALGEPCRSMLTAFYLKNASMEEIRTHFGYTNTDNAKTQKYKCLKRLKRLFFEKYANEGGKGYEGNLGEG